ncbi:MAG: DUF418 domain-containing protein [Pseudomonadota bacterium]
MSDTINPAVVGSASIDDEKVSGQAPVSSSSRIETLDFIRGLAVMGILAANIVAFGQPFSAYMYPDAFLSETNDPSGWQWVAQFVLIDGKMRGLFTLLFGAGMVLFMDRVWAREGTRWLQFWRLALLAMFGLIHFFFIWMGDILFVYGVAGMVALLCLKWSAKTQFAVGLTGYCVSALLFAAAMTFPFAIAESSFGDAPGMEEAKAEMVAGIEPAISEYAAVDDAKLSGDYGAFLADRFENRATMPLLGLLQIGFETLPLMLVGMALYRMGFFSGGIGRRTLLIWGWVGLLLGGVLHLLIALYVQSTGFGFYGTMAAFIGWSFLPRLAMVIGLAAILIAYSPAWTGWLAQRIRAAGRAAFTNYLGTSIVMLFVMHGWGLGLYGQLDRPQLYLLTLAMCVLMLAWSKPWLDRFRYGPLEWLWRCLTYRTMFPLRR